MYKNAGIKSKKEAAQRLINGEVFYSTFGEEIKFDGTQDAPFRFCEGALIAAWGCYAEWHIKVDWRDNIGDGVLCWVWDAGGDKQVKLIKAYKPEEYVTVRYKDDRGNWWAFAEPLTLEEAKKFIWGERYVASDY